MVEFTTKIEHHSDALTHTHTRTHTRTHTHSYLLWWYVNSKMRQRNFWKTMNFPRVLWLRHWNWLGEIEDFFTAERCLLLLLVVAVIVSRFFFTMLLENWKCDDKQFELGFYYASLSSKANTRPMSMLCFLYTSSDITNRCFINGCRILLHRELTKTVKVFHCQ